MLLLRDYIRKIFCDSFIFINQRELAINDSFVIISLIDDFKIITHKIKALRGMCAVDVCLEQAKPLA